MTGRFGGKRVLVTGAAAGIGRSVVELLSSEGGSGTGIDLHPMDDAIACDVSDWGLLMETAGARYGSMPRSDIADAVAYLACDAAASVTGAVLSVDRGTAC